MRVVFSITYYSPYVSGLTIYVKRLAEEMAEKGSKVSVLCWRHEKGLEGSENLNGVRVVRVKPMFKVSKGFLAWEWITKSWAEVKNHDVVVVNLPQAEGVVPAIAARILRKKLVAVYHCEIDIPNKMVQRIVEVANWITLKLAHRVVAYTKDYAVNSRLLKNLDVDCIYPPIPHPSEGGFKLAKPKGEIWIGVAARLAREKGIEYLIETLPFLKNCKIIVAGPMEPVGEEEYKNMIMKLVEKYKNRVVFLGTVKPEEMGGFYKAIDVLALPSINSTEAFGMVQVEAMMCGVPVVATDLPGVRVPINRTGMGVIVPVKNSKKLAEAIGMIINDKKRYVKDRESIVREFNYEGLFREILG